MDLSISQGYLRVNEHNEYKSNWNSTLWLPFPIHYTLHSQHLQAYSTWYLQEFSHLGTGTKLLNFYSTRNFKLDHLVRRRWNSIFTLINEKNIFFASSCLRNLFSPQPILTDYSSLQVFSIFVRKERLWFQEIQTKIVPRSSFQLSQVFMLSEHNASMLSFWLGSVVEPY